MLFATGMTCHQELKLLKCPSSVETTTFHMFDELWQEIQDAPGEIFDIPEMKGWNDDDSVDFDDLSFGTQLESEFDF